MLSPTFNRSILLYASLLHFSDEVQHIWKRKFTLPTYLYIFSKYPAFVYFCLLLYMVFSPEVSSSLRLCNVVRLLADVINIFPFIGVQGLITVRTYSLCQGYRPMAIALSITYLTTMFSEIYAWTVPTCITPDANGAILATLIGDMAVILSDILAFSAIIHQIWGLWKLKRSLGLQNDGDFLTLLLQQGVLRFVFVLFITTTNVFLTFFIRELITWLSPLQNALSALLICEFTLDLRRRNTQRSVPNQSAISLQTLSFQENPLQSVRSILERFHKSIMAEMGENNNPAAAANVDGPGNISEEPTDLQDDSHHTNLDHDEHQGV